MNLTIYFLDKNLVCVCFKLVSFKITQNLNSKPIKSYKN